MSIENNETNNKSLSFEESTFSIKSRSILGEPQVPAIVRFMVNKGLVKNSAQATTLLLIITVLLVALSIFFMIRSTNVPPAFPDSKSNNVSN
jgi:hypothetical protein